MTQRLLLRKQLAEAWNQVITDDYRNQRINSERSLHASLWSRLNSQLSVRSRRMFIEPRLNADVVANDGATRNEIRFPDIVVCNTREVIGIVEIKYLPRTKPNWRKDMDTFLWIIDQRDQLSVQNVRHRGLEADGHVYRLAKDVLLVWAGIHAPLGHALSSHIDPRLTRHFVALHAETSHGQHPQIIVT